MRAPDIAPTLIADSVTPRIDISEKNDEVIVTAELPGLDKKDVEVSLTHNVLLLRGEKKVDKEKKDRDHTYTERSYGFFERHIPLDVEVLSDKVSAAFKNGCFSSAPISSPPTSLMKPSCRLCSAPRRQRGSAFYR